MYCIQYKARNFSSLLLLAAVNEIPIFRLEEEITRRYLVSIYVPLRYKGSVQFSFYCTTVNEAAQINDLCPSTTFQTTSLNMYAKGTTLLRYMFLVAIKHIPVKCIKNQRPGFGKGRIRPVCLVPQIQDYKRADLFEAASVNIKNPNPVRFKNTLNLTALQLEPNLNQSLNRLL